MADGQPGLAYVRERLGRLLWPPVTVVPPPEGVHFERDLEVRVRDGTVLRVNLFRPAAGGPFPVLMSAHPYGKDNLPAVRLGRPRVPATYRLLRQTGPVRFSAWTGWEAPDPAYWTAQGYAVVNCDLRGFFRSEGRARLLSQQEGEDYHDLIEWAGTQPWSSGKVGLCGVSYLALSQYRAAALRPPHLAAICPWEGFSDVYRDLAYPGGVREDGFVPFWIDRLDRSRLDLNLRRYQKGNPLLNETWDEMLPPLELIQVPALVCASFSDHNLHTRGSFAAFERIGSRHKWLYTHRTGKWAAFYSEDGRAWQKRFFDRFLKGEQNGMESHPPVRLEVRESRDSVSSVRPEAAWPLPATSWTHLYLSGDGKLEEQSASSAFLPLSLPGGVLRFAYTIPRDLELVGPMKLRLLVACEKGDDFCLFVGVRKLRGSEHVPFEGSYGFGYDLVTRGWHRGTHRDVDEAASQPWRTVYRHRKAAPLKPGDPVSLEIELLPSATQFRGGETLRLDLQGRYFFKHHPLLGQFPAAYEESPSARLKVHCGGKQGSYLLVPRISP